MANETKHSGIKIENKKDRKTNKVTSRLLVTNNYGQSHLCLQLKFNVKPKEEVRLDILFRQINPVKAIYVAPAKMYTKILKIEK